VELMRKSKFINYFVSINIFFSISILLVILFNFQFSSSNLNSFQNQLCKQEEVVNADKFETPIYSTREVSIFPQIENLTCLGLIETIDSSEVVLLKNSGETVVINNIELKVISSKKFLTALRFNFLSILIFKLLIQSNLKNKYSTTIFLLLFSEICFETLSTYGLVSSSTLILTFNFLFLYFLISEKIISFKLNYQIEYERIKFRSDINVLRGLAVLLVVLYHLNLKTFINGFLGVDIFFVISGFLISSQILNQISNEYFTISSFYAKRLRRLLPSLLSVTIFIIVIFYNSVYPFVYKEYLKGLFWNSFYFINVYLNNYINYFNEDAFYNPILHLWSISVEEQFYIFYPLIFVLFFKKKFNYQLLLVIIYIASLSYFFITENYYLIFSRFWQFILGYFAYLIFVNKKKEIKNKNFASFIYYVFTFLLIIFNKTLFDLVELTFLISLLTLFFIVSDNSESQFYTKYLKLIGIIGTFSYSIYLFHNPIIVWFNLKQIDNTSIGEIILAILFISYLNYFFIEKPLRYSRASIKKTFALSGLSIGLLVGIILYIPISSFFDRLESNNYDNNSQHYENMNIIYGDLLDTKEKKTCQITNKEFTSLSSETFDSCFAKYGKPIVVLGDSHADDVFNMLRNNYSFLIRVGEFGCRIRENHLYDRCNYEIFKNFYEIQKNNIGLILYNQSGFYFTNESKDDLRLLKFTDSSIDLNISQIRYISDYLKFFDKEKVRILGSWIEPGINPLNFSYESIYSGKMKIESNTISTFTHIDTQMRESVESEGFVYISTLEFYLFDKNNYFYDYNRSAFNFVDNDHLSSFGEEKFSKMLIKNLNP
jgi:peptidoglycan/LPS O-acetylase OafA/YrhL